MSYSPCSIDDQTSEEDLASLDDCDCLCDSPVLSNQMRMKLFGVTAEEMKMWTVLQRLGVTYEEFLLGNEIFASIPSRPMRGGNKLENVTGVSTAQMKRAKAVSMLGTTEDEIYESRARMMGSIGSSVTDQEETISTVFCCCAIKSHNF